MSFSFFRRNSLRRSSYSSERSKSNYTGNLFRSVSFRRKSVAVMVTTEEQVEPRPPRPIVEEPTLCYQDIGNLAKDMETLAFMPELCDVTFLVGRDKKPICAVKSILAARSS